MKLKEMVFGAWCLVPGAKKMLAVALCAVGLAAQAAQDPVTYLDWDEVNHKLTNATCTAYETVTASSPTSFAAGKTYVVTGDVTVSTAITVNGTEANPTRLILCDGKKLTAKGGLAVSVHETVTNALVICAQSEDESTMGRLTATVPAGATDATMGTTGIGGKLNVPGGIVTINGGVVTSIGDKYGAGIGGGNVAGFVAVTVNGGVVTANGGESAAGIGAGGNGHGGMVTINGGKVNATGGAWGAGIGGGNNGHNGTVVINGGTVTATASGGAAGIGGGWGGNGGTVAINGGSVTATSGEQYGVAIGGGDSAAKPGTVTFGAGFAYGVLADGLFKDQAAFSGNHTAKSVTTPAVGVKIPAPTGYSYVVSNETAQLTGVLADGTNTYGVVTGATVKVYFTPDEGYIWKIPPKENPMVVEKITGNTDVDEAELPTTLALMGVAAFDAAKTYDGEGTNVTWAVTNYLGEAIEGATVYLRERDTTMWMSAGEFEPYVDVTNATVEVKAEKDGFTTASNKATVVISPRAVTLTSGSESFVYDGRAHSNMTVTVMLTGGAAGVRALPEGEGIVTNGFATITNVGSEPNAFSYEFLEGTKAENYLVSCVTGMLTVTKAKFNPATGPDGVHPAAGVDPEDPVKVADPTIPFSSFDTTNVYDGVGHTIDTNALENAYKDLFLGNKPSFTYALSSNGSYHVTAPAFTNVTVTSVWYKVSAANFEDVIHPAKVIVTNRCVTLTSKDAEWPYDGQAHSNMTVTAEGFVEGEGVTTNGFATITDVGSKPNAFSYEFLDGTKAENYSVSCVTGTLTIAGYFVEYNGSGADGAVAVGVMEMDTFGSTIETNLTRCAFTLENFVFSGWTTNGVDKAYDDEAAGKDFAQPGETLSLTALWTRVIVPVAVTNLAHTTVSVTTNDAPVELFKTVNDCGIYNVQTNADVMIVYRAVSGWAFDASGTNGTVVLSNVTWSVNDFVPEEALPKVVPITSVITDEDVEDGPDGTVIIKSCHPTADGVLIIPATIGGKRVIAIADKAFQYATWLKELVIENGPTEIGNAAFDNCSGLALVKIPASVTKVGQVAFMRCFALKTLEFAGDAPAMQKLAKLGYGICWGAHGFDVKVDPDKSSWDETSLGVLCAGWQKFEDKGGGTYTCTYDSAEVKPRITGVEWLSSGSKLTVNNVKPGLTYTLEKSACLGAMWETVEEKTGGETDTLEFEIPGDTGASAFFRVTVSDGSDK